MTSRKRARKRPTPRAKRRTKPRRPTKKSLERVAGAVRLTASAKAAASLAGAERRRKPGTKATPAPVRWNPEADDVQRSVVQLVLTLVELVRKLMERQAIRRMEQRTLTRAETEAVGAALMEIERTIRDIGVMFNIKPEDLNLDLGAIKLL